jgi:hypothetical protein
MGAQINVQTWEVSQGGATVTQYPPCTSGGASTPEPEVTSSGGYYAQTTTPSGGSKTVSDNFGGTFTVPGYPSQNDTGEEYWSFWPGLVAYGWPSAGSNAVLQPTLDWISQSPGNLEHEYYIRADLDFGSPGNLTSTIVST